MRMVGLPEYNPSIVDYRQCIATIEEAVGNLSVSELEQLNLRHGQAGGPVLTKEQYSQTPHGKVLTRRLPPLTVRPLEELTPPVPLPETRPAEGRCLRGIRVLELARVIAGPTIGRSLAAYGAQVLKVTSPQLPDVPLFQVDVNAGKHTTSLHLRDARDRAVFEDLLQTADVLIDGYRPGALARLGYSPERLGGRAVQRGRGIVYVAADCFGGGGEPGAEWAERRGWQQIADCVTGVAWEQGRFMGLDEPVVPPFPMSDHGTGCIGAIAAMAGLHRRATRGGSWIGRTSLSQYDVFLLSLGAYPPERQDEIRSRHDPDFFRGLRHHDSVDEVSRRALASLKRLRPSLFGDAYFHSAYSEAYQGVIRWPREAVQVHGLKIGHVRPSRPNGFDAPTWDGWEADDAMLADDHGLSVRAP